MGKITEEATYEADIYQLETTDPVEGGKPVFDSGSPTAGHANASAAQLANRTAYLKERADIVDVLADFKTSATFAEDEAIEAGSGVFYLTTGAIDNPEVGEFMLISAHENSSESSLQIALHLASNRLYHRVRNSDVWGDWALVSSPIVTNPDANTTVIKHPDGRIEQYGTIRLTGLTTSAVSGANAVTRTVTSLLDSDFDSVDTVQANILDGINFRPWISEVSASILPDLYLSLWCFDAMTSEDVDISYHVKGKMA